MADLKIDSLSRASQPLGQQMAPSFEPSKPLIPRLINLHRSIGKTGDQASHHFLDRLERENQELKIWSKEEIDHLQALANRSMLEQACSYINVIAQSLTYMLQGCQSIAAGGAAGPLAGSALIALGITATLQEIFTHFGVWDWICETLAEKNQALKDRLKAALPFVFFVLSMATSTLSTRRITPVFQNNSLIHFLEALQPYLSGATHIGKSYLSIEKSNAEAHHIKIQGELQHHQQTAELLFRFVEVSIQEIKRIKTTVKKPIHSLMQATTLASQRV